MVGINDFDKIKNICFEDIKEFRCNNWLNINEEHRLLVIRNENNTITIYHIHIVKYNNENWNNRINFRDYLNNNVLEAKRYELMKIGLANKFSNNIEGYTKNKLDYFYEIYEKAREWKKMVNNQNCT
jgi:GrpB-like predicted nucleotidyltransferase (UPF0157 family)